ncbi:MAG: JAB domain-containing protein [Bacteroidetes bacterium]|nr:JAB domain-containing protein [Bacteroidota bacterium]
MDKSILSNIAEVKIRYSSKIKASERTQITCSQDGNNLIRNFWDEDMEHIETMKLILLNRANKVLGVANLSTGGSTGTICDVKVVFQYAIKCNAANIILVHNHPSGNTNPSNADKMVTKKVKDAGEIFGIQLLDHLILTPYDGYFSFSDEGLI